MIRPDPLSDQQRLSWQIECLQQRDQDGIAKGNISLNEEDRHRMAIIPWLLFFALAAGAGVVIVVIVAVLTQW